MGGGEGGGGGGGGVGVGGMCGGKGEYYQMTSNDFKATFFTARLNDKETAAQFMERIKHALNIYILLYYSFRITSGGGGAGERERWEGDPSRIVTQYLHLLTRMHHSYTTQYSWRGGCWPGKGICG